MITCQTVRAACQELSKLKMPFFGFPTSSHCWSKPQLDAWSTAILSDSDRDQVFILETNGSSCKKSSFCSLYTHFSLYLGRIQALAHLFGLHRLQGIHPDASPSSGAHVELDANHIEHQQTQTQQKDDRSQR